MAGAATLCIRLSTGLLSGDGADGDDDGNRGDDQRVVRSVRTGRFERGLVDAPVSAYERR